MGLTPKQEMFVQGIVSGLSQREAYKQAYNTAKMKNETIDNKAYLLFSKGEVRVRYNELIEEHKQKALWTREEAVKDLIWLKEEAKVDIKHLGVKQANSNAFINAIKELNALEDLYPKKDTTEVKEEKINQYFEELEKVIKGEY